MAAPKNTTGKSIETITHDEAKRLNIPTGEQTRVARKEDLKPVEVSYTRRDPDLDPQLIWRGKYDSDGMDGEELLVRAAPLYIQEKVHPKALIDDLKRESDARAKKTAPPQQLSLFADFNGIPEGADKYEFYKHEQNWSNRLILGDSLQVMAGLAEREGLRGQVQCIYFDPPYGIKFNSNFQWSTTNRDVKDNKADHITREPEQVKAFRDTWKDGIHSYLSYIRDRLVVARDLLTESGSFFVQIGEENQHRVRDLLDEVFGENNFVSLINFATTTGFSGGYLSSVCNYILWYAKDKNNLKYRQLYNIKEAGNEGAARYKPIERIESLKDSPFGRARLVTSADLTSQGAPGQKEEPFMFHAKAWLPPSGLHWKTTNDGLSRLACASRIISEGNSIRYARFIDDFQVYPRTNVWLDIGGVQSRTDPKIYVVQTATETIARCILMTTDPGDLALDPTCGSGTTAYVAEQWGRRWITIDTSRVALALARARLMGARYSYYLLADSKEGQKKEAEITNSILSDSQAYGNIAHGFVYERVPHITLKSIAYNAEIDVIWEKWQAKLEPLRDKLNAALGAKWEEWEIPREASDSWTDAAQKLHAQWWEARIGRQKEIDASISAKADTEYLYDKPYTDNKIVRVAGPFTVESQLPHRNLIVDEKDELIDPLEKATQEGGKDFTTMILEELKAAGVQQANKEDKIVFASLKPWPGRYIKGEGIYLEGETERRAAVFIGPEFGSVQRSELIAAAKEATDAYFDVMIACAFNYDAASSDLQQNIGRLRLLKARMNADLHMSTDLKNTGKGNLFIIFGEPDIEIEEVGNNQVRVHIKGVDIFDPAKGEVRSDETDNIACWFIDTDYNEESFFVRHAYFLGANDPYKALQTSLKSEIDREAWDSLHSAVSRPFDKPKSGRIAVKVINHLGDEVMKVYPLA